jgi:hypothetical protein
MIEDIKEESPSEKLPEKQRHSEFSSLMATARRKMHLVNFWVSVQSQQTLGQPQPKCQYLLRVCLHSFHVCVSKDVQ